MASSIPLQLAETVQTAHIRHNPSALLDITPSTAADSKEAVVLEDLDDDAEEVDDDDDNENPYSAVHPWHPHGHGPQRFNKYARQLPALPDLRFEQSYLRSIAAADSWWKVALVTARDQLVMPFTQGLLYNLAVCGWQHWNRTAQLGGQSAGARLRRWWYGVNNWAVPRALVRG